MVYKVFEVFNNHVMPFNATLDNWCTSVCYWVNPAISSFVDKICVFGEVLQPKRLNYCPL